jgi:hypothetical protein
VGLSGGVGMSGSFGWLDTRQAILIGGSGALPGRIDDTSVKWSGLQ